MRSRFLVLIFQLSTVIMFFFPIYYINEIMISGLSFIINLDNAFEGLLASRIISVVMAIGLITSLITFILTWVLKQNEKINESSIISFNLTLVVGLLLLVVQGAYMSYLGYIWIGLMIATAYLRSLKDK